MGGVRRCFPPFCPTAIRFCSTRHNKIFLYIPAFVSFFAGTGGGGGVGVLGTHGVARCTGGCAGEPERDAAGLRGKEKFIPPNAAKCNFKAPRDSSRSQLVFSELLPPPSNPREEPARGPSSLLHPPPPPPTPKRARRAPEEQPRVWHRAPGPAPGPGASGSPHGESPGAGGCRPRGPPRGCVGRGAEPEIPRRSGAPGLGNPRPPDA